MNNALILLQLLSGAIDQATRIKELMVKVHAEGRDVTNEELAALMVDDADARAALQAEIDRQKQG
jgi:hypothetical protein